MVIIACFSAHSPWSLPGFSYQSRKCRMWPVLLAVKPIPPGKRWSCHQRPLPAAAKKSMLNWKP